MAGRWQNNKRYEKEKKNYQTVSEIEHLKERIKNEAPQKGTNPLAQDFKEESVEVTYPAATKFEQLPISELTLNALNEEGFKDMTPVQRASIPHSLCGRDILGAAKTGSGKTLAFLIPTLELLYREKWNMYDGLGALILSPTRELAAQTFEVLCKIGKYHTQLSAGLVIGGNKNLREEAERIHRMNILIATPGRILQHIDKGTYFKTDNIKLLVLDEADQILDKGFKKEIDSIMQSLPTSRQTLLFSATQTASVGQLARLSLKEPEFVSVDALSKFATPSKLVQTYTICELHQKINFLWSFIRNHKHSKVLIFLATTKQVRFMFECFKLMRPGIRLMHIHGQMAQAKRLSHYWEFHDSKFVAMFCTDIASRGLDFKDIDWVLQMDCPENTDSYIHRVGRTARFTQSGNALLVLNPSEEAFVKMLEEKKIPIQKIEVNTTRINSITSKIQDILVKNSDIKIIAQKAIKNYLRSVHIMSNKDVFKFSELPIKEFAQSYGLIGTPNITFKKAKKPEKKIEEENQNMQERKMDEIITVRPIKVQKTQIEKLLKRKNNTVLSDSVQKLYNNEQESDDDLFVKRTEDQTHLKEIPDHVPRKPKKEKEKGLTLDQVDMPVDNKTGYYDKVREELKEQDPKDRKAYNKRIREQKALIKQLNEEYENDDGEEKEKFVVTIGNPVNDSEDEDDVNDNDEDSEENNNNNEDNEEDNEDNEEDNEDGENDGEGEDNQENEDNDNNIQEDSEVEPLQISTKQSKTQQNNKRKLPQQHYKNKHTQKKLRK